MRQSKLNAKIKEAVKTNPSVTKKKIHPDAAHLVKSTPRMEGTRLGYTTKPDRVINTPSGQQVIIRDNGGYDMLQVIAPPIKTITALRDIDAQLQGVSVAKMTRTTPRAPITANYDGVVPETRFSNHRPKRRQAPASSKRLW